MPVYRIPTIAASEITPEAVHGQRRRLLGAGLAALPAWLGACGRSDGNPPAAAPANPLGTAKLDGVTPSPLSTRDVQTTAYDASHYNNYYEFGTGKDEPAVKSARFVPRPWTVAIGGECEKPGTLDLDDLLKPHALEERIYRMRCVEAWSMVIPWVGIPLGEVLARFAPTSKAKYVAFTSLMDPQRMPGQLNTIYDWPYREGLRIDEAMHPLAILAVGMYGHLLPNQSGAPLRLVVPWKYGFKGIKAIVRIDFVEQQPRTLWNDIAGDEYGFYANVNPAVDHPRWSQASERRIVPGKGLFDNRIATLPFNGYAEQVASLYTGMDLRKNY